MKTFSYTAIFAVVVSFASAQDNSGKVGVIEPGAYADIILVDGNPLEYLFVLGASFDMWAAPGQGSGVDTIPFGIRSGKAYTNSLESLDKGKSEYANGWHAPLRHIGYGNKLL